MCLGIPGRVEEFSCTEALQRTAMVNFGGIRKSVNLAFVPDAKVGDYVIVHVGFAISIVDEEEALRVFEYLEEIGQTED